MLVGAIVDAEIKAGSGFGENIRPGLGCLANVLQQIRRIFNKIEFLFFKWASSIVG